VENFKGLNLVPADYQKHISDFCHDNNLEFREYTVAEDGKKIRITMGRVGIENCIVDLYITTTGTTTITYKTGRNREIGLEFARYLYSTIDSDDFEVVNYSIKGVTEDNINPVLDELTGNTQDFTFTVLADDHLKKQITVQSKKYHDQISITHYKTTSLLLLQGRPLFVYREFIYLLSELLDLSGLQNVLSRTDKNTASIVRSEIAKDYLKEHLNGSYHKLPKIIENLLVAGCCVKLASPKLPEYSLLLFPDLRALEGVLKQNLSCYQLYTDQEEYSFGAFFDINSNVVSFKEKYKDYVTCGEKMVESLINGYTFLRKHRNTLFHMSDFAEASRKIDDLDKAISLSKDTYKLIDDIYSTSKIL
jgi:hypothetical protein